MQDCLSRGRHRSQKGNGGGVKIGPAMAMNIRMMYAKRLVMSYRNRKSPFSILEISKIYGVEHATIWGIVKSRTHLEV